MQVKTIAFYHYTFPAGGAEVVTCNLGRFFAKHGFRVLLYTWKPNAELLTEELRKIFDIRPLPDTKRISGARNTDLSLRIAENRAGRRPVHTSNHRHRIRADPDAHHGQNHFLPAQHAILGGIRPEAQKVVGNSSSHTDAQAGIRTSAQACLPANPQTRTTLRPTVHPGTLERGPVRDAMPGLQRRIRTRDPPGRDFPAAISPANALPRCSIRCCRHRNPRKRPKRRSFSTPDDSSDVTNASTGC